MMSPADRNVRFAGERRRVPGPTDVNVRDLDRQRAIVMFKSEIASDAERAARPFRGNTVLIVQKAREGWMIVAGQAAAVPAPK